MTPREVVGMELLARAQPMTTTQWARLLGMSAQVGRRSLQKLRNLKLVTSQVVEHAGPNRYTLAPAACGELARRLGRDPSDFSAMGRIGAVNLPHHETTVDLGVALTVAAARSKVWALERLVFERALRSRLGDTAGALVPDAVGVFLRRDGLRLGVAIETDLASENPSYVARTKFQPYAALAAAGDPLLGCESWVVACAVPNRRRVHTLASAAWESGAPEGLFYFGVLGELTDREVLTCGWLTPRVVGVEAAELVAEMPWQALPANPTSEPYQRRHGPGGQESSDVGQLPSGGAERFWPVGGQE